MKSSLFDLDIEDYEIGYPRLDFVDFPSFYGLQKVKAPVYVYRATKEVSPCVVVTACMHGDEINGLRTAQLLMKKKMKLLKGTLIVLPTVNIYGFLNKHRYLPDRKDINRCFPGKNKGNFGSRFADFIFRNVTRYGDVFIDLHSGGAGRFNIPQIRCDLSTPGMHELVENVSIPLVVNSALRDGSLREAISELGKPCIVFEGGEGLRIDETIAKYGLNLIKSVLHQYGMIKAKKEFIGEKFIIKKRRWMRASRGGLLLNKAKYGKIVKEGEVVGELRQMSGDLITKIRMEHDGVILGMSTSSLVMAGDALYHIGFLDDYNPDDLADDEGELSDYFDFES
ncbi:succinylglutamate desuccinylase/aspartoacylase family protein [Halobacteriovorax sp.]|uniref:succinylglutamate desuccinylase/aspartoacylase family protein n=1 Tax=Halobacteriovorax sp. TaxID=2020862 RepID=UPI003AF30362